LVVDVDTGVDSAGSAGLPASAFRLELIESANRATKPAFLRIAFNIFFHKSPFLLRKPPTLKC